MLESFNFAPGPELVFGKGQIKELSRVIRRFGSRILLVTGNKSFDSSVRGQVVKEELRSAGISVVQYHVDKEPSPLMVDDAVQTHSNIDVVVAIGGGSALDAGKAISAMAPIKKPVRDFLEGVGTALHPGTKLPFIAVPTTAGTGSEATKNAVLSEVGPEGYKRSLRHANFVPDVAIVDPELTLTCSPFVTATSGIDAFTQLLESYLSTLANPISDALAEDGLRRISTSLLKAYYDGGNLEARSGMALAAYQSGVTLANAGLGTIHGFASSIGSRFDISHGLICSALMYPVNKVTVEKLREANNNAHALQKYAATGKMFSPLTGRSDSYYIEHLLYTIESMRAEMKIPGLATYGMNVSDIKPICKATDNKYNPVVLTTDELEEALTMAL